MRATWALEGDSSTLGNKPYMHSTGLNNLVFFATFGATTFHNALCSPDYTTTLQNFLPHSSTFHNTLPHSTPFHHVPHYSTTLHNIPPHSTMFLRFQFEDKISKQLPLLQPSFPNFQVHHSSTKTTREFHEEFGVDEDKCQFEEAGRQLQDSIII